MLLAGPGIETARKSFVFRAAPGAGQLPSIAVAAAVIYTPTVPIEVIGFDFWSPAADLLVAAGGATLVKLALANGAAGTLTFFINAAIATWNNNGEGGGFYTGGGGTSNVQPNIHLYPGSFLDSTNATTRCIAISCDVGTITGTVWLQLTYRRISLSLPSGTLP